MPGSRFSSSTRPSSSAWVVEACSSSFTECNPNSRHILSFERTYAREAGLSPTRITARPGVTPFVFSSAISRRRSTYTFSAIARPSINLAIVFVIPSVVEEPLPNPRVSSRDPSPLRCAQDDKDSAHFNQLHHGVLQGQTFRFKVLRCRSRFDMMWPIDQHTDFSKRPRHDEPVPTSESATLLHLISVREKLFPVRVRTLGQADRPV